MLKEVCFVPTWKKCVLYLPGRSVFCTYLEEVCFVPTWKKCVLYLPGRSVFCSFLEEVCFIHTWKKCVFSMRKVRCWKCNVGRICTDITSSLVRSELEGGLMHTKHTMTLFMKTANSSQH
ncbi:hypothetical protein DPMN_043999 [Dreissena polymorpha]|uniref:Uncharacterized protein n=1 Tax=Dreissena polymorpha TaxID=45954 RepID=A0A9D4D3T1_DREPO|nr:hypothetical protein DPMN_043999 [Dreissena polymorpha]